MFSIDLILNNINASIKNLPPGEHGIYNALHKCKIDLEYYKSNPEASKDEKDMERVLNDRLDIWKNKLKGKNATPIFLLSMVITGQQKGTLIFNTTEDRTNEDLKVLLLEILRKL